MKKRKLSLSVCNAFTIKKVGLTYESSHYRYEGESILSHCSFCRSPHARYNTTYIAGRVSKAVGLV